MPWTETDEQSLIKLKRIRAAGVRSTSFGDRRTDYMSAEEIDTEIARLETQKSQASSSPRPKQFLIYHNGKGF